MGLSHRERVLFALEHQEPDRVPLDLGGTQTSLLVEPYDELKRALGIHTPTETQNIVLGLARIEEAVLERFDIDFRHILPRAPSSWKFELLPDDSFYDEWGVRWRRPPGGYYYDMVEHPLSDATLDALSRYTMPDPTDPGRVAGVAEEARQLRAHTDYAIEAGLVGLWESAWFLVGFERWMLAVAQNREFVEALLESVLQVLKAMHTFYLAQVGEMVDLVTLWDDYGAQFTTLISPQLWRALVKPRLADLVAAMKSKTKAHIGIHSCGAVAPLIDDLLEIGIDVLNPLQVSARGMNPLELKKRYGNRMTFWGGIDTQRLLPGGTVSEVRQAVKETIRWLAPGGGYILAAVHNIQPGVPAENIIAMYDTARQTRWTQ
jgi:uroporphyrinogen decarboxylase